MIINCVYLIEVKLVLLAMLLLDVTYGAHLHKIKNMHSKNIFHTKITPTINDNNIFHDKLKGVAIVKSDAFKLGTDLDNIGFGTEKGVRGKFKHSVDNKENLYKESVIPKRITDISVVPNFITNDNKHLLPKKKIARQVLWPNESTDVRKGYEKNIGNLNHLSDVTELFFGDEIKITSSSSSDKPDVGDDNNEISSAIYLKTLPKLSDVSYLDSPDDAKQFRMKKTELLPSAPLILYGLENKTTPADFISKNQFKKREFKVISFIPKSRYKNNVLSNRLNGENYVNNETNDWSEESIRPSRSASRITFIQRHEALTPINHVARLKNAPAYDFTETRTDQVPLFIRKRQLKTIRNR